MKEPKIEIVSKKEAERRIKNHRSFVLQIPCDDYNYMKVELANGYNEGIYGPQIGPTISVFKYKLKRTKTKKGTGKPRINKNGHLVID